MAHINSRVQKHRDALHGRVAAGANLGAEYAPPELR